MAAKPAKRAAKPWHDWREDARELVIVVAGVFIALVAQEVIQAWEWKQKVDASTEALRRELLDDDGPEVYQRVALFPCMQAALDEIRKAVEEGRSRAEIARLVQSYKVVFVTYDRVAYEGATASEIWTHMSQQQQDRFTVPYTTMPTMDALNRQEAMDLARLRGFTHNGGPLTKAEESQLLTAAEALRNDNGSIYAAAQSALPAIRRVGDINKDRIDFYMGIARSAYGNCPRAVPANWPD